MTISELKGIAVSFMNANPSIAIPRGGKIGTNFVVEAGMIGGVQGLRFGDSVWLLKVDAMPRGVSLRLTGKPAYLVVQTNRLATETADLVGLLDMPRGTVQFYKLFEEAEEAVHWAATTAAGQIFIEQILRGDIGKDRPSDRSINKGDQTADSSMGDVVPFPEVSYEENTSSRPISVRQAREFGAAYAAGLTSPQSRSAWDEIVIEDSWFGDKPALAVDQTDLLVFVPDIPAEIGARFECPAGIDGRCGAPMLISRSRNPLGLAVAAAFPSIDWITWTPVSIHAGWAQGIIDAVGRAIARRHEKTVKDLLARGSA